MIQLSVSASSGPAERRSTQAHYAYVYTCAAAVCVYSPEPAFLCFVWAHNSKEVAGLAMQARHGVLKWLTLPRAPAAVFSLPLLPGLSRLQSQHRVRFAHCKKKKDIPCYNVFTGGGFDLYVNCWGWLREGRSHKQKLHLGHLWNCLCPSWNIPGVQKWERLKLLVTGNIYMAQCCVM